MRIFRESLIQPPRVSVIHTMLLFCIKRLTNLGVGSELVWLSVARPHIIIRVSGSLSRCIVTALTLNSMQSHILKSAQLDKSRTARYGFGFTAETVTNSDWQVVNFLRTR
jgi:hypothetical protein